MEVRFLRAMCEIAISCLQKCPQASVLRAPRKKRSRFLRPPIQVGSENLGCSGACLWSCRWIVGCSSWTAPRSGRSGRRKKKRRGNHVKIVRGGQSWGHLGPSWGHVGPSWDHPEGVEDRPGAVLGPSGTVLGRVGFPGNVPGAPRDSPGIPWMSRGTLPPTKQQEPNNRKTNQPNQRGPAECAERSASPP